MSRMTEMQIYAAIRSSQATAAKHEAAGKRGDAAAARRREARLRLELKERIDYAVAHDIPLGDVVRDAAAAIGVLS